MRRAPAFLIATAEGEDAGRELARQQEREGYRRLRILVGDGEENAGLRHWIRRKGQERGKFNERTGNPRRRKLKPERHQDIAHAALQVLFRHVMRGGDSDFPERAREADRKPEPHLVRDGSDVDQGAGLDGLLAGKDLEP